MPMTRWKRLFATMLVCSCAAGAQEAEEPEDTLQVYEAIQVTGRDSDLLEIADSASEGVTGSADLERRPILRPGELLETVPGVIVTQHSGSGKANQYSSAASTSTTAPTSASPSTVSRSTCRATAMARATATSTS